jgi:hypothetical protein
MRHFDESINVELRAEYYYIGLFFIVSVCWDAMPYSPLKSNRCYGSVCYLLILGLFFFCLLFFDPDDVDNPLLRNVSRISTDYMMLYSIVIQ